MYSTSPGYIRLKSSLNSKTPFLLYIRTLLLSESALENFLRHVLMTLSNCNFSLYSIYISSFALCLPPLILIIIYMYKSLLMSNGVTYVLTLFLIKHIHFLLQVIIWLCKFKMTSFFINYLIKELNLKSGILTFKI